MLKIKNYLKSDVIIGCNNSTMTKDQTEKTITAILERLDHLNIEGASISEGLGVWQGKTEKNITLTIINNFTSDKKFKLLINELYLLLLWDLKQEEITIIYSTIQSNL